MGMCFSIRVPVDNLSVVWNRFRQRLKRGLGYVFAGESMKEAYCEGHKEKR